MTKLVIDGSKYSSMNLIHNLLAHEFDFGPYYGANFSSLWDYLSTEVERPFEITIINCNKLKSNIEPDYDKLIKIFEKLRQFDEENGFKNKFKYNTEF